MMSPGLDGGWRTALVGWAAHFTAISESNPGHALSDPMEYTRWYLPRGIVLLGMLSRDSSPPDYVFRVGVVPPSE